MPFLSVTGSDFMEMFVGVGASRVRDLFQSARKMGRAIIFVDEIDSIGRKRGAGLGGGHDEREQTLNQMLAEMDGFEVTTGIVMIAATNRPDILDPALLRPGRFDRQVVVPLPELDDRRQILEVHVKHKRMAPDVDLDLVARGTPGMSGADLSNLVNEAALFAVRDGSAEVHKRHFEDARDRVLMGQRRESMVLSDLEKEAIAYHEAGHAVCAAVLPTADPLHKVTIIPSGMALGVTMQLPIEERHIYRQDYIEDSLVVRMGGRIAEELVFGVVSTGANNDLVGATELARKMVREWGMSSRVGPMAWGSQGQVFLGEDLMHTRDYSDDTARVIDEEVERILREAQERCRGALTENRHGLDLVARALLEHETIDGVEVTRLLELARAGATSANPHSVAAMSGPSGNGGTDGLGASSFPHTDQRPRSDPGDPGSGGLRPVRGRSVAGGFGARVVVVVAALRGRARLAGLGHRRPQVGGRHRAEEVRPDDPGGVGDQHQRHRIDAVAAVQLRLGRDLHPLHGDRTLGPGVERHRLLPHPAAGLAGGGREHDDQPRGVGTHEVGPVELYGHVPVRPGGGGGLAPLDQHARSRRRRPRGPGRGVPAPRRPTRRWSSWRRTRCRRPRATVSCGTGATGARLIGVELLVSGDRGTDHRRAGSTACRPSVSPPGSRCPWGW